MGNKTTVANNKPREEHNNLPICVTALHKQMIRKPKKKQSEKPKADFNSFFS